MVYDLDDFIFEMENQPRFESTSADLEDVYAQLAQKEKDLILAAELGKALLEKNEHLHSTNERLSEDYTLKLEVSSTLVLFLCCWLLWRPIYIDLPKVANKLPSPSPPN